MAKAHTHGRHTHTAHTITADDVERINAAILRWRRREGLCDTPHQTTDKRWREYCDDYNRTHSPPTHNTQGGWHKPHLLGAQTAWQRRCEQTGEVWHIYHDEPAPSGVPITYHTVVLLWEAATHTAQAHAVEVVKTADTITIKIKAGRRKVRAVVNTPPLDTVPAELLALAITHHAEIYTLERLA